MDATGSDNLIGGKDNKDSRDIDKGSPLEAVHGCSCSDYFGPLFYRKVNYSQWRNQWKAAYRPIVQYLRPDLWVCKLIWGLVKVSRYYHSQFIQDCIGPIKKGAGIPACPQRNTMNDCRQ